MQAFAAHRPPLRTLPYLLTAIGLLALSVWATGVFGDPPKPELGWAGIVLFGSLAVGVAWLMLLRNPALEISAAGIMIREWSDETIPWTAIADVAHFADSSEQMVVLHLHEPERYPPTQFIAKLMAASFRRRWGGHLGFGMIGMDRSTGQALAAISRWRFGQEHYG